MFHHHYEEGSVSLQQENKIIGKVVFSGANVSVTFRGSQRYKELWSSRQKTSYPLKSIGISLEGNAHKGYCLEFETLAPMRQSLIHQLRNYEETQHLSLNDLNLTIEGSSKGAMWATLTAAELKVGELCKNSNVYVLTYALAHIFDEAAVKSYDQVLGKMNHLNFWSREDLIARYADISDTPIGNLIEFSSQELEGYKKRVQEHPYTNMLQTPKALLKLELFGQRLAPWVLAPFKGTGLSALIEPQVWEAHVDPTYEEWADIKAPCFFKNMP